MEATVQTVIGSNRVILTHKRGLLTPKGTLVSDRIVVSVSFWPALFDPDAKISSRVPYKSFCSIHL